MQGKPFQPEKNTWRVGASAAKNTHADGQLRCRSLPMLSGLQKSIRRWFCKKIWKNKKNSVGTEPMTNSHLSESSKPNRICCTNRGIRPLAGSSSTWCYTARPIIFETSNGLTVHNRALYENKENQKAVAKHFKSFVLTVYEKARASVWTVRNWSASSGGTVSPIRVGNNVDP